MGTKNDAIAIEAIKNYTSGQEPDAYIYGAKNPPFIIFLFTGLLLQRPHLLGVKGEQFIFIRCNWGCNKFREEHFIINKSDIREVKYKKFGWAHYFTIIKNDGTKLRYVANQAYNKLEKQADNLEKVKVALGV